MRVLDADAMREVDRQAIEDLGIPSLVLMENAALGVVDALAETFPEVSRVAIFCGPGNNGGDGFAVGRHLAVRGYEVELFLARGRRPPEGDAAVQLGICRRMGLEVVEIPSSAGIGSALETAESCDLVVDALFGTGLGRPLGGHFAELVEGLSRLPVPCLAVDLPSGLDASSPHPIGAHVEAELTVTFAAPKVAQVLPPAAHAVGRLVVADLGIPPRLIDEAAGDLFLLLPEEVGGLLEPRPREGHKGTFGHLLGVAVSPGKSGAAVLAARSAVRGGAGLVTLAVPRPILDLVDGGCLEAMALGLPATPDGALAEASVEVVLEAASGKTAAAVGPGLGTSE
ncbi:MAG: NAD(P)H-hydrate epimerase, partial [Acidobacteria bacterium]|nr:NAD(P)H-hydrate epimerase [Acidobacteriota bacterium]